MKDAYNLDPSNFKKVINVLNFNIQELNEIAFVWEFIEEKLKKINFIDKNTLFKLHCVLQNYYIRSNIDNGNWKLLCNSPLFKVDFGIKYMGLRYDYEAFNTYINHLNVSDIIKESEITQLINIRQHECFYNFMLMFDFLTKISDDISSFKNNYNKFLSSIEKPNLNIFKLFMSKFFGRKQEYGLYSGNSSFCIEDFYNKVNRKFDIFVKQTNIENQEDLNDSKKNEIVKNTFLEAHAYSGGSIIITNNSNDFEYINEMKHRILFKEKMEVQIHANQGSQVNVAEHIEKVEFISIGNNQISEADFNFLKEFLLKLESSELFSLEEDVKCMHDKTITSNGLNSLKEKVDGFLIKHALPISNSLTATMIYEGLKILFRL